MDDDPLGRTESDFGQNSRSVRALPLLKYSVPLFPHSLVEGNIYVAYLKFKGYIYVVDKVLVGF